MGDHKLDNLVCEINYYFDSGGIGFHGDKERNIVFGGSVGGIRYIDWCSIHTSKPVISNPYNKVPVCRLVLFPGDAYIMSEVATGHDWMSRDIVTIRHRAGDRQFLARDRVNPPIGLESTSKKIKVRGNSQFEIQVLNDDYRYAPFYDRDVNVVKGPGRESLEIVTRHDDDDPTTLSDDEAAMDQYRGRVDIKL